MATNPFFPGYNPADQPPGRYPGAGMPRKPVQYTPKIPYFDPNEELGIMLDQIDYDINNAIKEGKLNIPKWIWDRSMGDIETAFAVNVFPKAVDPLTVDDYETGTLPGAYGLSFNFKKLAKDPTKELTNLGKNFVKSTVGISGLEDVARRGEDEFWSRATSGHEIGSPSYNAKYNSYFEKVDRRLVGQFTDEGRTYGVTPSVGKSPLALEGLNVKRVVGGPDPSVWSGRTAKSQAAKIIPATIVDPAKDTGLAIEIDLGKNVREKWIDYNRNLETPFFRGGVYHDFLGASNDFVGQDLANLKMSGALTPDDELIVDKLLVSIDLGNRLEDAKGAHSDIGKTLHAARLPGGTIEPPTINKDNPNLLEITAGGGKKKTLIAQNTATGRYSGQLVDLSRNLYEAKEAYALAMSTLSTSGDRDLFEKFSKMHKDTDAQLTKLESILGGHWDPADQKYVIGGRVKDLFDSPDMAKVNELRLELENYAGPTGFNKGLFQFDSLREGTYYRHNRFVANEMITDEKYGFHEIADKYGLESKRAIFFNQYGRRAEGYQRSKEILNSFRNGKFLENYLWHPTTKRYIQTLGFIAHPASLVSWGMSKVNTFGLRIFDQKSFGKFMNKAPLKAFGVGKIFENRFNIGLNIGGNKVKFKFKGGEDKSFGAVGFMHALGRTDEGKKALKSIMIGDVVDGKLVKSRLVTKFKFIDKHGAKRISYAFNMEYAHLVFPNGLPTDPKELQETLAQFYKTQQQMDKFKIWADKVFLKLGINPGEGGFDKYMDLINGMFREGRLKGLEDAYKGLLEKLVVFGNKTQEKVFSTLGIDKLIQKVGLGGFSAEQVVYKAILPVVEKAIAKLGLNAAMQAIGSVIPGIGNAAALVATWIAEKVVQAATKVAKNTLGAAYNLIVKGEIKDIMEEVDKRMVKSLKIIGIFLALFGLLSVFFGALGGGAFSLLASGPNGLGALTGSGTFGQQLNLASNPYIAIISTFAEIDPTREHDYLDQHYWDWDAWPPSGATPGTPGLPPPGGSIPPPTGPYADGRNCTGVFPLETISCNHDWACYHHNGNRTVDIGQPLGTDLIAPFAGTAVSAWSNAGYGYMVRLTQNGPSYTCPAMIFAHLESAGTNGQVSAGDFIGDIDSTGNSSGNHVHIAASTNGYFGTSSQDVCVVSLLETFTHNTSGSSCSCASNPSDYYYDYYIGSYGGPPKCCNSYFPNEIGCSIATNQ